MIRRYPTLYRFLKSSLLACRRFLPKIKYDGIPNRIHPNDFMLHAYTKEGLEEYGRSGTWLEKVFQEAFDDCGMSWDRVESFLEIGCGYGRHTRWLAQSMPPEQITVADVTKEAVEFCVSEFGVKGIISDPNVDARQFGKYTIIYAFSVLTHLSAPRIDNCFRLMNKCLLPGGIALFTLHGPRSIAASERIKTYLDPASIQREVERNGIAFYRYPHHLDPELGDTFVSDDYIQGRMATLCPHLEVQSIECVADPQNLWIARSTLTYE